MNLEEALIALGRDLQDEGYEFVSPTPETLRRVNARPQNAVAHSLTDVFGWSRKFHPALLPELVLRHLTAARALMHEGEFCRSSVRCSTLQGHLYFHSAYPTVDADAVFFGPDTYRFCRLIDAVLQRDPPRGGLRVIDIGCGTGAGGLSLVSQLMAQPERLILADVNSRCCSFARVNAVLAGVSAEIAESDLFAAVTGEFDIIVANPPYLVDPLGRLYRDGGGPLGSALSLRILSESLSRLSPGGLLILYSGSAIEAGEDGFLVRASALLQDMRVNDWNYAELDPDVFGEELETSAYRNADRIAAVGLVVRR